MTNYCKVPTVATLVTSELAAFGARYLRGVVALRGRYFRGPKAVKLSWGGKLHLVLLVHDKQMRFIVQYTEVSVLT